MTNTPRIYVASLSDYNAGRLVGAWIDADQDADLIREEIAAMLATSREPVAEEWAIHDYDGFDGIRLGEFEDIDTVAMLAAGISEHGEPFAVWVDNDTTNREEPERFEDAYRGTWDSLADYVEEFAYSCHTEDELGPYRLFIDWERVAGDWEMAGDVWTARVSDGVAVFEVDR